ncbi:diacylglycerol/polyprenol kinase family protein [Bdellovibrionota bacterium FG-1]
MDRTAPASRNSSVTVSFFPALFPVRLQVRTDLHLARKIWHMFMGMVIAFVYLSGIQVGMAMVILGSCLGINLFLETVRLQVPGINDRVVKVMGPVMRACEVNRVSGVPYYIAASMLAIAIFPKPVAVLSILYLACGDPIASFFGILYGKKSIRFANGKSLIGTLAGILTCTVVTFVFLKTVPVSGASLAVLTLTGGLAGGLAELVPLEMDDNFTIPVISGFVLWLAFILLGI